MNNELKEYLKRDLGVSDEEYKRLVDEAREKSELAKIKKQTSDLFFELMMKGVL